MGLIVGLNLGAYLEKNDPEPYTDASDADPIEKLSGETYLKKLKTKAGKKLRSKEASTDAGPDPDPYTEENETEATQNMGSEENETGPDPYTEVTEKLESEVATEASKKQESEETGTGPNSYIEKQKPKETQPEVLKSLNQNKLALMLT